MGVPHGRDGRKTIPGCSLGGPDLRSTITTVVEAQASNSRGTASWPAGASARTAGLWRLPDARHDWQYYERIREHDWLRLARVIANDLSAGREIQIPEVIYHFKLDPRRPFGERVREVHRAPRRGV